MRTTYFMEIYNVYSKKQHQNRSAKLFWASENRGDTIQVGRCRSQNALPKILLHISGSFSTHFTGQRKCAFTLAEVLITLGIIGVVAAMTLPALINNYKKAQTVSQLKASYSILSQAIKLSEVTNGEVKYWNFNLSSEQFFEKYLKGYLKMQKTSTLGEAKNK